MRTKVLAILILILLALAVAPICGAEPNHSDVLAFREAAWRAWFNGDEATLRSILPDDFLAIGWGGNAINDREKTIASSKEFKKTGGRLVSLAFPETRTQQIGDTVIFYGSFEVTIATGEEQQTVRGRLTE